MERGTDGRGWMVKSASKYVWKSITYFFPQALYFPLIDYSYAEVEWIFFATIKNALDRSISK